MVEEIEPVTFKQNPMVKVEKKTITKVVQLKPSVMPKKTTVSAKMENNGVKK